VSASKPGDDDVPMNEAINRQKQVIERSGLGLLPGLGLALALVLVTMASLLVATWWVTFCVLAVVFAVTGAVVWTVFRMADDDTDEQR
jgi:uncharacterized membrane protein